MVTVYTKQDCMQCKMTKNVLTQKGIEFTVKNVTEHPEYRDEVLALDYQALPVVVTDDDSWFGFRPDKINELAE